MRIGPWLLLFGRTVLFATFQALVALVFYLAGSARAWEAAADWWMLTVVAVDVICLAAVWLLFRAEGRSYWDNFRIRRADVVGDLLAMLAAFIVIGPISLLPNTWLATWLFGDPQAVGPFLIRALPVWGVYLSATLFAVAQGLVERALYFVYVMPRLFRSDSAVSARPSWLALTLSALMLGLQHVAIPWLFDARYLIWRGLMFVPFAFLVGLLLRWRPRLLPYLAIVHALMDFAFGLMLLPIAY
jgi:hypothetical protein